ncbi:MAG TPA: phosphate/phosphite/phosphonate ABC transporter substrate-binding protein [Opitutaceae bacterium]
MRRDTLLVGAVAFGPAAVTIWDGFKAWFNKNGLPFDYILYSNYDRQNDELLAGHIDACWNDPLSWVQVSRKAASTGKTVRPIVMRDIDFDLTSALVVRADSNIRTVAELKGRVVAVGSPDSVESTLVPLSTLRDAGLRPGKDYKVHVCESSVGYRGGKQVGEVRAAKAVVAGEADAAGLAAGNYDKFLRDGTIPTGATRLLAHTPKYDHCNLTVAVTADSAPAELVERMRELFLEMPYDDPELRPCMDLEAVKEWRPARVSHYATIERALDLAQPSVAGT